MVMSWTSSRARYITANSTRALVACCRGNSKKARSRNLEVPQKLAADLSHSHGCAADRMQNILVNYLLHVGTLPSETGAESTTARLTGNNLLQQSR